MPTSDPQHLQAAIDARLAALTDFDILDTPSEPAFDGIVDLAARLCDAPIALISFVARDRQWFKAETGLGICQTPIEQSVCAHALAQTDLLIIPDLTQDARTCHNTLVTGAPHIRFYAGAPLIDPAGTALGTLCVIDTVARPGGLTELQRTTLSALAKQVMATLELRALAVERGQHLLVSQQVNAAALNRAVSSEIAQAELRERELRARLAQAAGGVGTFEVNVATSQMTVSAEFCRIFGLPVAAEYPAATMESLILAEDKGRNSNAATRQDGSAELEVEYRIRRADTGAVHWIARRGEFLYNDQGEPLSMFGTVQDVTLRKQATERLSALVTLGDALREATSRGEILEAAMAILGQTLSVSRAGYADINRQHGLLTIQHDWTQPGIASLAGKHPLAGFEASLDQIASGQALVIDDVLRGITRHDDVALYAATQVQAKIDIPLRRRGELVDVMFVHMDTPRQWLPGEIEFAQGVAERTYAALQRLQGEALQQVLNNELSHRLKNTLAMVQAIANRTLRGVTPQEPVTALRDRIFALSAAHDVLLKQNWTDADLKAVAVRVLDALSQADRIDLTGPPVALGPRAALSTAMLLHELSTNALKYGALSNDTGRVALSWTVEGHGDAAELRLHWREHGGPAVRQPEGRGFGSQLIDMGLIGTGGVTLRYVPDGFEADMTAMLSEVQSDDGR